MSNCNDCGGAISQYASHCGHCGKPLSEKSAKTDPGPETTQSGSGDWTDFKYWNKERKQKVGGTLLIACMVLIFILNVNSNEDSDDELAKDDMNKVEATAITSASTSVSTAMPTTTEPPAPIQMNLTDVFEQYDLNKVRANSLLRYQENGKIPVSTSGYVSEVERHHVVIYPTQERYSSQSLFCYYADIRTALHLSKGQSVSVTGKIRGMEGFLSRVHMFACDVEEVQLDKQPNATAQDLRNNVVQVYCLSGSIFSPDRKGTGIIMNPSAGIILTVHHVVADENECEAIEVELPGIDGRLDASIIEHCASIDRARLRVPGNILIGSSLKPIYRATAPAQPDQEIFFWGYGPGELRLESGIVKDVWSDSVITDAYAVPGDSGSPVFNENGHLLGTLSRSNRSDRAVFTGDEC